MGRATNRNGTAELKQLLVTNSAVRRVPLDALGVDPSYQRDVKPGHKKIVASYNPHAFGVPLIGERRDATLWIVDGLQRITAAGKLGFRDVRAEVFASRGPAHEAEVFKLVNLGRTQVRPMEAYKALLAAHDPESWAIKEAVEAAGFKLQDHPGIYEYVRCINTLRRMHRAYPAGVITFALTAARLAWPGDCLGTYNDLVEGVGCFYAGREGQVDMDRLIPRLKATTPYELIFTARRTAMGGSIYGAVAKGVEAIYTRRLGKRKGV